MDKKVRTYLARIGSKGGKKSRRTLTTEQSNAMLWAREFRRARRKIEQTRALSPLQSSEDDRFLPAGDFLRIIP